MRASGSELTFFNLESAVRYAQQPDDPCLVSRYLESATKLAQAETSAGEKRRVFYRVLRTLLDTICDTYLPKHWRDICLDQVYRPLSALDRLADSNKEQDKIRLFRYELRTLSHYFM